MQDYDIDKPVRGINEKIAEVMLNAVPEGCVRCYASAIQKAINDKISNCDNLSSYITEEKDGVLFIMNIVDKCLLFDNSGCKDSAKVISAIQNVIEEKTGLKNVAITAEHYLRDDDMTKVTLSVHMQPTVNEEEEGKLPYERRKSCCYDGIEFP